MKTCYFYLTVAALCGSANPTLEQAGGINATGSASDLQPPCIVTSPQAQTVGQGASVSFVAEASGCQPLSWQWRCNGINLTNAQGIGGATSAMLTLTNVQFIHAGDYSVVVSNPSGSVTSQVARLTVKFFPPPISAAQSNSVPQAPTAPRILPPGSPSAPRGLRVANTGQRP
jgi:hypothetical protein